MRWEYKTLRIPAHKGFMGGRFDQDQLDAQLNELGKAGWELVAAFSTAWGYGASRYVVAVLKRQR